MTGSKTCGNAVAGLKAFEVELLFVKSEICEFEKLCIAKRLKFLFPFCYLVLYFKGS